MRSGTSMLRTRDILHIHRTVVHIPPLRTFSTSSHLNAKASSQLLALSSLVKESDHGLAREWIDNFKIEDIPKDGYVVSRSRSSGPGGQHVNKTESKVTIRCDLRRAKGNWLPAFVFQPLSRSPHYLPSPPTILITSQTSRTASQNLSSALDNLHQTILQAAQSVIINPTSNEQKSKVKGYIKKENERRLEMKKRNSAKKASRKDVE
ncbi:hypothetical protein I302_104681 [Kwoniella bestiolae CBS 10118]|uniref:Peptidyl-tRNA hydrolase ICT1 n=1 Tax=Kwoniella bestiolae CBS 10118 TaxID=1296100 RepID=A0A1B9FS28_9TREE|nr:peptidyl-tRNA hydrolase ICT1 [Kwoniella bestiolae CBS 10118]OCF21571.1 peptidyl-tRNA hydrolase ICT1 [Kwoniella bestiolae CBS 10118]